MAEHTVTAIKQISECFIRPYHEVEQSKQPYYLAALDIVFLAYHPMQKGLLFIKPPNFNIKSFLEKLQCVVSLALVHFYPLAGRLATVKYEDDHACSIYVDCNKGPGARFIHASCDIVNVADVISLGPDLIPIIRSFFELGDEDVINYDGHTRALLTIQVTELIDGVFIGFTMNHSLADGTSFWHFVNSLSELFIRSMDDDNNQGNMMISQVPIYKRVFLDTFNSIIKLPSSDPKSFITRFRPNTNCHLRERIFHLSSESIAKLKAQATDEWGDKACGQISSFQSICAFFWRSITRARRLGPEVITTLTFAADARTRLDPPLLSSHFGNLVTSAQGSCKVDELLQNKLGWVAMILRRGIAALNGKMVHDINKIVLETILRPNINVDGSSYVGGEIAIVIGGSVRFNSYGSEFGLGKAVAIRSGYSGKTDGKVTVSPGSDGGGSVDLEVSLSSETMDALERDQEFMTFVS